MNPMIFLLVLLAVSSAAAPLVLVRGLRHGGPRGRTGDDPRNDWHPMLPSRSYGAAAGPVRRQG